MRHFEEIHIEQFRGLQDLKLEGLGQINLLVGGNNSGKTSVLEAIDLHCHPLDVGNLIRLSRKRELNFSMVDSINWMFPVEENKTKEVTQAHRTLKIVCRVHGEEFSNVVRAVEGVFSTDSLLKGTQADGVRLSVSNPEPEEVRGLALEMVYVEAGAGTLEHPETQRHVASTITALPMFFTPESSDLGSAPQFASQLISTRDYRALASSTTAISEIIKSGDRLEVIALLKFFDDEIEGVELLDPHGSGAVPFLLHRQKGYMPLAVFGDGLIRVFTLACAVVRCKDGVLLIDELEIAVHSGLLEKVFSWLVKACKAYHVQLFATTHSLEAVDAVLAAFLESDEVKENPDSWEEVLREFVTYRLVQKQDKTIAKRFAGDMLADLRYELGQDVR